MNIEAMKQALEALENAQHFIDEYAAAKYIHAHNAAITSLRQAIAEAEKQEPVAVQVSPLDFVEMVMEKEHLIGRPIIWAEWPSKEENNG